MQSLQIDATKARKLYPSASPEFKEMLQDSFGADFFKQKITDRVKNWEDVCEIAGVDPVHYLPYQLPHGLPDEEDEAQAEQRAINAFAKLSLIRKVLNEEWEADWNNSNQYKWYPYFNMGHPSGFGLDVCDGWYSLSLAGSRLCYRSKEIAEYAATQFQAEYKQLFLIQNT